MEDHADSLINPPRTQFSGPHIVATLGPASSEPKIWEAMLAAGASGFRLNTSHLSRDGLECWLERLDEFLQERDALVVLDLQGSKWRLGQFEGREVVAGEQVVLVLGKQAVGGSIPVPHADFFTAAAQSDGEIILNDAKVWLRIERSDGERVIGRVSLGGPLGSKKGITLSQSNYRSERLSEKDQAIYHQAAGLDWVRYALSYVKDGQEMVSYRERLGDRDDLIAKLEREPALVDVQGIQEIAGELWLCRGDLGAELGMRRMAEAVHRFSQGLKGVRVPVLLAGQVLEHMVTSATPTRSEVCCLYDGLKAGYAGVVLSDETAVGRYPVEACTVARQFSLQQSG
ncbi:MAG TPA: pyruvate kinase [Levilinea sp.]|nr:pyruvate kinase [Levilinea sp.]